MADQTDLTAEEVVYEMQEEVTALEQALSDYQMASDASDGQRYGNDAEAYRDEAERHATNLSDLATLLRLNIE